MERDQMQKLYMYYRLGTKSIGIGLNIAESAFFSPSSSSIPALSNREDAGLGVSIAERAARGSAHRRSFDGQPHSNRRAAMYSSHWYGIAVQQRGHRLGFKPHGLPTELLAR